MSPSPSVRQGWRSWANIGAAVACVAAGAFVLAGGQKVFLLSYVDIGFHELGHLVFAWLPGLIPPLAGSATQVAVPLLLALYFLYRHEDFASALIFAWAATAVANVAVYAADAPSQTLSLLGDGRHDWAWVLGPAGHLDWAGPLAAGIHWFAVALAIAGLLVAVAPLLGSRARERAEARRLTEWEAHEAAMRAQAPRRDPRNAPPTTSRQQLPPPAPASRF